VRRFRCKASADQIELSRTLMDFEAEKATAKRAK
jgi:hypothetical protein